MSADESVGLGVGVLVGLGPPSAPVEPPNLVVSLYGAPAKAACGRRCVLLPVRRLADGQMCELVAE